MRLLILLLLNLALQSVYAQVAINTTGTMADPSAMLDVQSQNKGFLPPRMNYDNILAITNPAAGLQVYDTTYNCLRYYNGTRWIRLAGEIKEPSGPLGESVVYGDGTGTNASISDICADSAGNIYVTGWYNQATSFGPYTLVNTSAQNGFITKYDKNGKPLWARQTSGSSLVSFRQLAWANGFVYAYGEFGTGTLTIGGSSVSTTDPGALVVVRLDVNGNLSWMNAIKGTGVIRSGGLAANANGNVYLTGNFTSSILNVAPGFSLNNNTGMYDAFIVKYNAAGTVQWTKQLAGNADDKLNDVLWYNNTLAATGSFESSSLSLNAITLTNPGAGSQLLVLKLDENGNCNWAQQYGVATVYETGKAITCDETGTLFVAGEYFGGNTVIGSSALTNLGGTDGLLVRIPVSGTATGYAVQSSNSESITGISYARSFVYISANSLSSTALTVANISYPLIPRGGYEMYITRMFAPNPGITQFQWIQQQGSTGNDNVSTICADPYQHNIYTGGFCNLSPAVFGSTMQYNAGYYIWRYNTLE
ncbi:MAG: hypothetical protein NTW29_19325 [Bacteroidetes bacterium]|nr:hypothetical protein [Bacteroidota bacterium]